MNNILGIIALLCAGATHTYNDPFDSTQRTGKDVQECQRKYIVCATHKRPEIIRDDMYNEDVKVLTKCIQTVDQK